MFESIIVKVKNGKLSVSTDSVLGKEKVLTMKVEDVPNIEWAKDIKTAIVTELIKKEYGDVAVAMSTKAKAS